MTIHLATDHAGYDHKNSVRDWLILEGYDVVDHGAYSFDPEDDFPVFIVRAAQAVSKSPHDRAIIFGGSGQGEAMLANRFPAVRATVLYSDNQDIVSLSREHNDANTLSVGARFVSIDDTKKHIWSWLHTDSSEEKKYRRRIDQVASITKNIHV